MPMFEAQETWRNFPKVELHVHIDCSLSYRAVRDLAPGTRLADWRDTFIGPTRCEDLVEFLVCVDPAIALMQTKQAVALAVDDMVDQLAADNVRYAELRFAPLLHTREGLAPELVVETALEAMHKAAERDGITCRMILCTLRHYTEAETLLTADLALRYADQGVVAMDLAADENSHPLDAHIAGYAKLRAEGLDVIAHAGEARGADSVHETLEKLGVSRIGHGVRSIEDPAVVDMLGERGVHLEVCPTSNIQTAVFADLADHSVQALRDAGLSVGINTDGRTVTNTTLSAEYLALERAFGWGQDAFRDANLAALAASFAPAEVKDALAREIRSAYSA